MGLRSPSQIVVFAAVLLTSFANMGCADEKQDSSPERLLDVEVEDYRDARTLEVAWEDYFTAREEAILEVMQQEWTASLQRELNVVNYMQDAYHDGFDEGWDIGWRRGLDDQLTCIEDGPDHVACNVIECVYPYSIFDLVRSPTPSPVPWDTSPSACQRERR